MATFNIQLDRRKKLQKGLYNLVVRVNRGNDMIYLNIYKLTEQQYDHIFVKKSGDEDSIAFRENCEAFKTKCERTYNNVKPFNKARFRALLKKEEQDIPNTLLLKDLFTDYLTTNENIKHSSRRRYRTSMNVFETFMAGATVYDVTPDYLKRFEKSKLGIGNSPATIASNITDLKRILNYYTKVKKVIPKDYEYPFSEIGYRIKNFIPNKSVLTNEDIKSIVKMKDFDSPEQEYARDIWLLLYRCNGSNFADLLRMRWSNIDGKEIRFYRLKTETTRKKNVKQIIVPIKPDLNKLLQKIGDKSSPFVLGLLPEGYSEATLDNKSNKMRGELNEHLRTITTKLNLSLPLRINKARECYATTLRRAKKPIDQISEAMGHSTIAVTMNHYVGGMNSDEIFELNDALF
jgi:integrase